MNDRPAKHSVTLNGHRTSVSLEPEFWAAFKAIAAGSGQAINSLAAAIDADRGDLGLASAIRLFILRHYQRRQSPGGGENDG